MKLSPLLERKLNALRSLAAFEPLAELRLPGVRIKGTTNGSQGVTIEGRRFRRGKQAGLRSLGHNAALSLKLRALLDQHGPLVVQLERVAPYRLDGDNLEASFKRVRDGLAKCVGVDDRSPHIEYVVDDVRGAVREYAVQLRVFRQEKLTPAGQLRKFLTGPDRSEPEIDPSDYERPRPPPTAPRGPTPNVRRPR